MLFFLYNNFMLSRLSQLITLTWLLFVNWKEDKVDKLWRTSNTLRYSLKETGSI